MIHSVGITIHYCNDSEEGYIKATKRFHNLPGVIQMDILLDIIYCLKLLYHGGQMPESEKSLESRMGCTLEVESFLQAAYNLGHQEAANEPVSLPRGKQGVIKETDPNSTDLCDYPLPLDGRACNAKTSYVIGNKHYCKRHVQARSFELIMKAQNV